MNINIEIVSIAVSVVLSILAIIISLISLLYTIDNNNKSRRPYFTLESLIFDPSNLQCYTTLDERVTDKVQKISLQNLKILQESKDGIYYKIINGEEYILINLLSDSVSAENDVYLFLNVLECNYCNIGGRITNFSIQDGYSRLKDNEYLKLTNCDVKKDVSESSNNFNLKIAYACREGRKASLLYHNLLSDFNCNEAINILKNHKVADKVVNFNENCFSVVCEDNRGHEYKFDLILTLKEDGIYPSIRYN